MRFSQAIRFGAMAFPLCRGAWLEAAPAPGGDDAGCLISVALRAVGWRLDSSATESGIQADKCGVVLDIVEALKREWPWVTEPLIECLVGNYDTRGWTAQQIADWVEAEERKRGLWDAPVAEPEPALAGGAR